ncbi:MAG: hypothetical protein ACM3ML_13205 [Micromonosporaceae bacterium]
MSARNGQLRDRQHVQPVVRVSTSRLVVSLVIVGFFAAGIGAGYTKTGAIIGASVLRWLTYYAGVLALIGLTAAVGAGLVATDRIFMSPDHRILAQAVHRAFAFVGMAFLVVHIATEIIVGRSTAFDSVIPFLAKGRTFYVGVGTLSSDLFILIIATGIARRRFVEKSTPLRWRIMHGAAYAAWPMAIIHGLAAGRHAKPYVDWSYGGLMILVGLALVLRSVATVRPKQDSAHAWPNEAGGSMPAAALAAAQAYVLRNQQAAALAAGMPTALAAGMPTALPVGVQAALPAGPSAAEPPIPHPRYETGPQSALYQAMPQPAAGMGMPPIMDPVVPDMQQTGPIPAWPGTPGHAQQWATPPSRQQWEMPEWEAAEWEARWQQPAQWAQTPPEGMPLGSHIAAGMSPDQVYDPVPAPPEQPPANWDWTQTPAREMGLPPASRPPYTSRPPGGPRQPGASWPPQVPENSVGSFPRNVPGGPGGPSPRAHRAPLQGHVLQSGPTGPVPPGQTPPEQPPVTWEQTPAYGMRLPTEEPPGRWTGR